MSVGRTRLRLTDQPDPKTAKALLRLQEARVLPITAGQPTQKPAPVERPAPQSICSGEFQQQLKEVLREGAEPLLHAIASCTSDPKLNFRLERVVQLLAEAARQIVHGNGAAIALMKGNQFICQASSGTVAPPVGIGVDSESKFTGECIRSGKVLVSNRAVVDLRVHPAICRLGVRSIMAVPVLRNSQSVGVFLVLSENEDAFAAVHIGWLRLMADQISRMLSIADNKNGSEVPGDVSGMVVPGAVAPAPVRRGKSSRTAVAENSSEPRKNEEAIAAQAAQLVPAATAGASLTSALDRSLDPRPRAEAQHPGPVAAMVNPEEASPGGLKENAVAAEQQPSALEKALCELFERDLPPTSASDDGQPIPAAFEEIWQEVLSNPPASSS